MKNKHGWKPLPALYLTDDGCVKIGIRHPMPEPDKCVCVCVCDAYLKHLQFDDENKPWHISMENFPAPHANLVQGRAPSACVTVSVRVCVCVCVAVGEAGSCLDSV